MSRTIKKILSVSQHTRKSDGHVYYKATVVDDTGEELEGYLIGEGDAIEVFFNEKWDYAQFIIKRPKKN